MPVRMTARHFQLNEPSKEHIEQRTTAFARFFDHIIDCHWVLSIDKHSHSAEVSVRVHGALLTGHAEGSDLRSSVDEAANKMEAQLKKYKGRLKDKDPKMIAAAKEAAAESEIRSSETASNE